MSSLDSFPSKGTWIEPARPFIPVLASARARCSITGKPAGHWVFELEARLHDPGRGNVLVMRREGRLAGRMEGKEDTGDSGEECILMLPFSSL